MNEAPRSPLYLHSFFDLEDCLPRLWKLPPPSSLLAPGACYDPPLDSPWGDWGETRIELAASREYLRPSLSSRLDRLGCQRRGEKRELFSEQAEAGWSARIHDEAEEIRAHVFPLRE